MRRRQFIAGLGSAAAWPVMAHAQQPAMPVMGVLHSSTPNELTGPVNDALHRGLAEAGFVEGQNMAIAHRWAENYNDRLLALAVDLVRRQVAVIATLAGSPAALAAKAATRTTPIVFLVGVDPVEYGLVASFARPGGNMTGFTVLSNEVTAKRMSLLNELVPAATSIALLFNATNPANVSRDVQNAARILRLPVVMAGVERQSDFEPAFANMAQQRVGAVMVSDEPLFFAHSDQVAALAIRHAIPAFFAQREAVKAGGLLSYGPNIPDLYRQIGVYAGRILKGEKPANLPVQQPTKLEFIINLKTAKALGLTIPPGLLAIVDEVIE
jgi:putative ABC transport system substrate-binding protein